MGNWCVDFCNNLQNTIKGQSNKQAQTGKKKAKFIDFNIGASTISKEEFKLATRKRRQEQERQIEQIKHLSEAELEAKLLNEMKEFKRRMVEQRIRIRKQHLMEEEEVNKERVYDQTLLEKDDLLQSVLGYSSLRMLNETACEPNAFFALKNSDELLWEDQSEYMYYMVLQDLVKIQDHGEYKSQFWIGYKHTNNQVKYIIEITELKDPIALRGYETVYFNNKQLQQRLTLLKQPTIRSDMNNITFNLQWFMLNYSHIFIRSYEQPTLTLRQVIALRKKLNIPFKETEILGLLVYIMRALRDAESIYINHGYLNDENIILLPDGTYKISEFGELRIARIKDQTKINQNNDDDDLAKSQVSSDFDKSRGSAARFTCTHTFLKYYSHKMKPHHQLFWNQTLFPVLMDAVALLENGQINKVLQLHDPEKQTWTPGPEEIEIGAIMMGQNFYSLAIIALQMMSLGQFEQHFKKSDIQTDHDEQINYKYVSEFFKSFLGFPLNESHRKKFHINYDGFSEYRIPTVKGIFQFLDIYKEKYKILYMYLVDMIQPDCDWKLIMDQLKEEDFEPPNDLKVLEKTIRQGPENSNDSLLNGIIEAEESEIGLLTRAFGIQESFFTMRRLLYKIWGYMLIRNYKVLLGAMTHLEKEVIKKLEDKKDTSKLHHYGVNNLKELMYNQTEYYITNLFLAISQMENRELKLAFKTLLKLEHDLQLANQDTLQYVNVINLKFYQGLVTYISGEAEDAMKFFDRVIELTKDGLEKFNEQAYFQFIGVYFLLQLDQDGYFVAFKYIEEIVAHHQHQCIKYNLISKDVIRAYFNRGKAYYEVSQFMLSRHYLTISMNLLKQYHGSGSDMDTLRLINLGYLSYVNFLINDMESMREYLTKSQSIMIESLSSYQCLETVVMWFNFFGFLLKSLYTDMDEFYQQIELFELTLERAKLKTDKFFKHFVFGKMYYYAGNLKKAQELFLDALMLQQYHVSDELRIKQTQNISSHQVKEQQDIIAKMLQEYQDQQKKFNSTLPPPERDNLTVRILIEVYDWLGFLYAKQNQMGKSQRCYGIYQELTQNLFQFEATLIDEYTLRLAKIKFYLKQYDECLQILYRLSTDLKKQKVDEDLVFEYQQIQSEISRWIGVLNLMAMKDEEAHLQFRRSREEIRTLINFNPDIQKDVKRLTSVTTVRFLSEEDNSLKTSPQLSNRDFQNFREYEYRKERVDSQKLQQTSILIIILQNYMKIMWHCVALGMKQVAINYLEECLDYLQNDRQLNSPMFSDVLRSSLKSDIYFMFGYLYGLRGQHEETNIYYLRTFKLVKEAHENNQLDPQVTFRMSVIYDQMSRVLSNQGFYIKSKQYLINSLHLLQNVKRKVDHKMIGYKNANLGSLNLRLGRIREALSNTERALKVFEVEYSKISVQSLTVKAKYLEILLQTNKNKDIRMTLLELIKSYQVLSEKDYSIRLGGQIDRLQASMEHKMGNFGNAYQSYLSAFVKLLEDNEVGMALLDRLQQEKMELKNILNIRTSDKASLEVALRISQLFIDNYQYAEAYFLLKELYDLSQGTLYDPPLLNTIAVFGQETDDFEHKQTEGIIKTLNCLNKIDPELSTMTVYERKRGEIMKKLRTRRHVNLLFQADIYRLIAQILNYWSSLQTEPFLHADYKKLVNNYLYKYKIGDSYEDIDAQQKNCLNLLLDALIIYQEAVGDAHENFIETLYLLVERQYLNGDLEDVDSFLPQVLGLVKNQNVSFPVRVWKILLIQSKTRLQQMKVGKYLIHCMRMFYVEQSEGEDRYLRKTIKMLKIEDSELLRLLDDTDQWTKGKQALKLLQLWEDPHRDLRKEEELLPGQQRIAMEAEKYIFKAKGSIEKFLAKMQSTPQEIEGNKLIMGQQRETIKYEIEKLQQIFDYLLKGAN